MNVYCTKCGKPFNVSPVAGGTSIGTRIVRCPHCGASVTINAQPIKQTKPGIQTRRD